MGLSFDTVSATEAAPEAGKTKLEADATENMSVGKKSYSTSPKLFPLAPRDYWSIEAETMQTVLS